MSIVTAIEIVGDDSKASHKAAKHAGKGILKMLMSNASAGAHVLVHYDDGTSSKHRLMEPDADGKKRAKAATFRVELPQGVEA